MQEKPEYYTVDEIAEKLRIRKQAVWKYIREEQLRAVKIGKYYRVLATDLDDFLKRRSERPPRKLRQPPGESPGKE